MAASIKSAPAAQVWVVDDDDSVRWVLTKALTKANYRVRAFAGAEPALADIDNNPPDVLITDIKMPGIDGLTLVERINQSGYQIPAILITAHADLENAVAAYQSGAFEYVPKPFDIDHAIELVRSG